MPNIHPWDSAPLSGLAFDEIMDLLRGAPIGALPFHVGSMVRRDDNGSLYAYLYFAGRRHLDLGPFDDVFDALDAIRPKRKAVNALLAERRATEGN